MSDEPSKPWSVAIFEQLRPHLTSFVRNFILHLVESDVVRRILLRAPVKCGKREIVEYIAMRDKVQNPTRVHAFLSAWHRAADEEQREELWEQNMTVFSITTLKKVKEFITWMKSQIDHGKDVILHLDECDYGSGSKQMLSKVWKEVRNNPRVTIILYSATPEEVLYSGEVDGVDLQDYQEMMEEMIGQAVHVEYTPPRGYCGPKKFLEENLIEEAIPFFHKEGTRYVLSSQGKIIETDLKQSIRSNPSRNIAVLRLSYSEKGGKKNEKRKNKSIHQFLENHASFLGSDWIVMVDKSDTTIRYPGVISQKIDWSNSLFWKALAIGRPILIVIDQTSSRSTEWKCHDRVFATHDFRNIIQYSTVSQAQERVNHYEQKYEGFQPIRVYGSIRSFNLSAGLIDYTNFLSYEWKSRKIDTRISPDPMFRITNSANIRHPQCSEGGLTEANADRLLQELGCYADISLSQRVAGSVRQVRTYSGDWIEATEESWPRVWATYRDNPVNALVPAEGTRDNTRNPFVAARAHRLADGTWQGLHRTWMILDCIDSDLYERLPNSEHRKLDLGWGARTDGNRYKVCYKNGRLGVFIARCTGSQEMNTLQAYNSMYKI